MILYRRVPRQEKRLKILTQTRLKELLVYSPDTGIFIWKDTRGGAKKGVVAGSINVHGYVMLMIDYKSYFAHRLAFLYMEGHFPENEVDHKNRDRADNSWANLLGVSRSCNMKNTKVYKTSKSGITGVGWHKRNGKWRVRIKVFGKRLYLGTFKTKLEAAQARWEGEVKYGFTDNNSNSSAYQYIQKHRMSFQ